MRPILALVFKALKPASVHFAKVAGQKGVTVLVTSTAFPKCDSYAGGLASAGRGTRGGTGRYDWNQGIAVLLCS